MPSKQLTMVVSGDLISTRPDILSADCLRVECTSRVNASPGVATRVNLTVHNTAPHGRMGHINVQFDNRVVSVVVPNSLVYVGPESKTVVYAIVQPLVESGSCVITFDVS